MKVKLTRDQRIMHKAGEIVEVSPTVYDFLMSTNSAEPVRAETEKSEKPTTRKRK